MSIPSLVAPALAIAALTASASAQLSLEWNNGQIGQQVRYELNGPPGKAYLLIPSLNPGPTPLSIIDILDTRVLDVGFDLLPFVTFGALSATGTAQVIYPVPPNPNLSGVPFYAQAFTFPGSPTLADDLSNPTGFRFSAPGDLHFTLGTANRPRRFASVVTLNDGRVLFAGGEVPPPIGGWLSDWEVFDPQTQTFSPGGNLPAPRSRAAEVVLRDGRVLLLGGLGPGVSVLASGAIFDPASDTFSAIAPMSSARVLHTATLLPDGRVLVVGGSSAYTAGHPIGYPTAYTSGPLDTTEIYDPAANVWTSGPQLPARTTAHQASRLGDGRVLITGGVVSAAGSTPQTTALCWIYDSTLATLSPAQPLPNPVALHAQSPMTTGGALVAGGADLDFAAVTSTGKTDALSFNSVQGWIPAPSSNDLFLRGRVRCIEVPGGPGSKVYYIREEGIRQLNLSTGTAIWSDSISFLDGPLTGWTRAATLLVAREGSSFDFLKDGLRILIAGGNTTVGDTTAEVFTVGP